MTKFSIKMLKYAITITAVASIAAIGITYPERIFPAFLSGWLVLIPMVVAVYVIYGLKEYMKDRKNMIVVSVRQNDITERYAELIRKEEEIKIAKEILYKELIKEG